MKFSGRVGFWINDVKVKPGVYKNRTIEKPYTGEVMKNIRSFQSAENQINDNLRVNNRISIISDLYMQKNWSSIKYVLWNGVKWKVSSVDVGSYPRVILELGGIYNGTTSST